MKVEYEKTHYEELIDILEEAYTAERRIKTITMSMNEYKEVLKYMGNHKFIMSLKRKVFISKLDLIVRANEPTKACMGYQIIDSIYAQSATLHLVSVVIV